MSFSNRLARLELAARRLVVSRPATSRAAYQLSPERRPELIALAWVELKEAEGRIDPEWDEDRLYFGPPEGLLTVASKQDELDRRRLGLMQ